MTTNNMNEYWSKCFLGFITTFLFSFSFIMISTLAESSKYVMYMVIGAIIMNVSFIIIAIIYYFIYKNL